MYLAESQTAALLETVFHDVDETNGRIYERDLRKQLLAHVQTPHSLHLADLRDSVLLTAGIDRSSIVSSPSEHYPCTRRLARRIHAMRIAGTRASGIVWNSRQAELRMGESALAMVVFADLYPTNRGQWPRRGPGSQNLYEGPGRTLAENIANSVGAVIV
jgi:hypothetical protein